MKLNKESAKAWKAEYDLINAMEREELKARLATETVEQSIKSYFALVELVTAFAGSNEEPPELQEFREKQQMELIDKWKLLAERMPHV